MGGIDPLSGVAPLKTPSNHPKLQHEDFDIDDKDSVDMKWWVRVEEHFKSAGTRLLDLEGHVSHPPADMPSSTLWRGRNWSVTISKC